MKHAMRQDALPVPLVAGLVQAAQAQLAVLAAQPEPAPGPLPQVSGPEEGKIIT